MAQFAINLYSPTIDDADSKMPTTRTPEGEPLKCSICGSIDFVLVSDSTSDSVCPSCGSFSWISIPEKTEPLLRQKDYVVLNVLVGSLRQCTSKTEISQLLVDGISLLFSPEAVSLSLVNNEDSEYQFDLFAHRGPSIEMSMEVKQLLNRESKRPTLTIRGEKSGVSFMPFYRHNQSLAGIIEIARPPKIPNCQIEERNRVIASLAAVAVGTHLLD